MHVQHPKGAYGSAAATDLGQTYWTGYRGCVGSGRRRVYCFTPAAIRGLGSQAAWVLLSRPVGLSVDLFNLRLAEKKLSTSVGLAGVDKTMADVDELIHLADLALYQAKGEGRDRCFVLENSDAAQKT